MLARENGGAMIRALVYLLLGFLLIMSVVGVVFFRSFSAGMCVLMILATFGLMVLVKLPAAKLDIAKIETNGD